MATIEEKGIIELVFYANLLMPVNYRLTVIHKYLFKIEELVENVWENVINISDIITLIIDTLNTVVLGTTPYILNYNVGKDIHLIDFRNKLGEAE